MTRASNLFQIQSSNTPFLKDAPSIMSRSNVKQPLLTEYAVIDALVPVSLRQRQLIIEDKGIGKTSLVLDIIQNQKRANRFFSPEGRERDRIFCVYVAIGLRLQKVKSFMRVVNKSQCD